MFIASEYLTISLWPKCYMCNLNGLKVQFSKYTETLIIIDTEKLSWISNNNKTCFKTLHEWIWNKIIMFIQQVAVQMIFLAIMGRTAKWLVRINWKNVDQLHTSIYSYVNTEFVCMLCEIYITQTLSLSNSLELKIH